MMPSKNRRRFPWFTLCAAAFIISCGKSEDVGGLMLMIDQDGSLAPDELRVRVFDKKGKMLASKEYPITDGDLPATLGLANKEDGATFSIRVSAWNQEVPLDVRDLVVENVPNDATKAVEIILGASCGPLVSVENDEAVSSCDAGETCDPTNGACQSGRVDASDLDAYREGLEEEIVPAGDGDGDDGSGGMSGDGDGAQSGGTGGAPTTCTSGNTRCGGDLTGTWNVLASCLDVSGDMDISLVDLGCTTVPATGTLEASGSLIMDPEGNYTDNTRTEGSVSFPLEAACLTMASVDVSCDDVGDLFKAIGWTEAACLETSGDCNCELTVDELGGFGAVIPDFQMTGSYSKASRSFAIGDVDYDYCAKIDTLTVTPQLSGLTGQAVFVRQGAVVGSGGTDGSGGMDGTGGVGGMDGTGGVGGMGTGGMGTGGMGTGGMGTGGMGTGGAPPATDKPCDIYNAAPETECVAAHSTVRALFKDYAGALYQVRRGDGMTQDIGVLSPGGYADSAAQESFCGNQKCEMWRIYDQSGNGNFLHAQTNDAPQPIAIDPNRNGMSAADAKSEKLTVDGHEVYSLYTNTAQAYWNNGSQNGMPLGSDPQGIYMVTSGTHYNGGCCYDYGNAQLDRNYHGGPTVDAVYFGSNTIWGTGEGSGPWVMADLEDGMLASGTPGAKGVVANKSLPFDYVTAMEKNNGTSTFAIKGGDATLAAGLQTMWDGPLPGSRKPMMKEGAVILGAGGDCCYSNNNPSSGTFYEGAIVAGYPSNATDEAIHANIVEAGYGE